MQTRLQAVLERRVKLKIEQKTLIEDLQRSGSSGLGLGDDQLFGAIAEDIAACDQLINYYSPDSKLVATAVNPRAKESYLRGIRRGQEAEPI